MALDHFDFLAKVYDRLIPPPDPQDLLRLLRLPIEGRLLDVGGGTGRVAATLRSRAGSVIVSDLSPKMLQQARRKADLLAVQSHAERLPFPDNSFHRVLVVDALHHFCDQRAAIQDLVRILAPGGRLVIEEPDYTRLAVKLVAVAEKLALMRSRFHTPEAIATMARGHARTTSIERDNRFRAWILIDG